ncbi:hypothetical protein M5689_007326 [Euphorbia peplus]|nr:hypothetical protein M5689_007326 [Euphorbia peplus]
MILVVVSVAGRIATVVGSRNVCFDTSERIRNVNPCEEATCKRECQLNNPHLRVYAHCTLINLPVNGIPCSCQWFC